MCVGSVLGGCRGVPAPQGRCDQGCGNPCGGCDPWRVDSLAVLGEGVAWGGGKVWAVGRVPPSWIGVSSVTLTLTLMLMLTPILTDADTGVDVDAEIGTVMLVPALMLMPMLTDASRPILTLVPMLVPMLVTTLTLTSTQTRTSVWILTHGLTSVVDTDISAGTHADSESRAHAHSNPNADTGTGANTDTGTGASSGSLEEMPLGAFSTTPSQPLGLTFLLIPCHRSTGAQASSTQILHKNASYPASVHPSTTDIGGAGGWFSDK